MFSPVGKPANWDAGKTAIDRLTTGENICGYACQYKNLIQEEQAEALDNLDAEIKKISEREYEPEEIEETKKLTKEFLKAIFGDVEEIEVEGEGEKEKINFDEIVTETINIENLKEGDKLEKKNLEEMKEQVIEHYDTVLKKISEQKDADEVYKPYIEYHIEYQNQMEEAVKEAEKYIEELTGTKTISALFEEEKPKAIVEEISEEKVEVNDD
jgi:hypothetical protein